MRFKYLTGLFTLMQLFYIAHAQGVIKTNLLHPVFAGGVSFAYELPTSDKSSISLYVSYGKKDNFALVLNKYSFYNVTVEERFYTSGKKENGSGFYMGPYLKFMHRKYFREGDAISFIYSRPDIYLEGYSLGGGSAAGYQMKVYRHWLVDFMGGIGTSFYLNKETGNINREYIDLRLGISIGYKY
jgi:hypothetical protein